MPRNTPKDAYPDRNRKRNAEILLPGERMRVPMTAMDSLQKQVAKSFNWSEEHLLLTTDALGNAAGAALHRPGPRFASDSAIMRDAQAEAAKARQEYLDDLTTAWKGDKRKREAKEEGEDDAEEDDDDGYRAFSPTDARRRKRATYRDPEN